MTRTNLIIGGSKGVGKEIYNSLSKKENTIILDKIDPDFKTNNNFFKVDITNNEELLKLSTNLNQKNYKFDVIFICYGAHHTKPVHDISNEEFKNIFDINFFSTINLIKVFMNLIKAESKIFYISSIAACTPIPYSSTYSSSKAALEAYVLSKVNEYDEKKTKHIIIQPGNINTGFNETGNNYKELNNIDYKYYSKIVEKINSKFGMDPKIVAKKIIKISYLKDPKNKYIIGKNAFLANIAKRVMGDHYSNLLIKKFFKIEN
tara:strand:+ start:186 stop:971 length:786 start_codon:yes stop_codon:yes gene_type:complete